MHPKSGHSTGQQTEDLAAIAECRYQRLTGRPTTIMTAQRALSFLVLLAVLTGCSRDRASSSDSTSAPAVAPAPAAVAPSQNPVASPNPCEHTGLWAECSIERRLRQSGFVVKKLDENPERSGFSIRPIVFSLGSSRLEVFIYDNETLLASDFASLDTLIVAPKGTTASWPSTPTLIHSANLAAVLMTQNQRQAERVMLAITAGPPQPGSPR
jgi:hypothetical protein